MTLRVLFVNPAAELGGAERSLLDVLAGLRVVGAPIEPHLLSFAEGPLLDRAAAEGARVTVLPMPEPLAALGESAATQKPSGAAGSARARVRAMLRGARALGSAPALVEFGRAFALAVTQLDPDLIHTNGMKAHWLVRLALRGQRPWVLHVRDFASERSISRRLFRGLPRRGIRVVANSRAVADDFRTLNPGVALSVVHNAVDTGYFSPGEGDPAWLAGLAGLPPPSPGTLSFGLVATYARWKGHETFIAAARELVRRNPRVPLRFYLVGGPIYATSGSQYSAAELQGLIDQADVGFCTGLVPFQAEIASVYRALNVIVHASTQREPFGRTIVEAMACGRPLIVARSGGASELFSEGETALGYEPQSLSGVVNCMQRVLDDTTFASQLGQAARAHATAHFGLPRLGQEIAGVYRLVLGASSSPAPPGIALGPENNGGSNR